MEFISQVKQERRLLKMLEEKTKPKKPKFLRRKTQAYSKLGKRRKKKQVWRKPTGRDNKMREKRKGRPAVVSLGYRSEKTSRNTLKNKKPVIIMNTSDLKKIKESEIAVIGAVGKKKKLKIAEEAKKMKIEIYNMNTDKFIEKNKKPEKKKEEKKEEKKKTEEKKEEKKKTEESKPEEKKEEKKESKEDKK
jgi:large subunit ribosomal protein L32e